MTALLLAGVATVAIVGLAALTVFAPDLAERLHRGRDWWQGQPEVVPDSEATAAMAAVPDGTARSRNGDPDPVPAARYLATERWPLPTRHRTEEP